MSLPVPIVGVDPGPDYAQNVNNCFFFLDEHDHSPGRGLRITPSGLNLNADLTFTNNSATNLKSLNFISQVSVPAIKSLYVVNNDLYFTDGNGNAFALTSLGGVAGTPGSIASLNPPASVTYNAPTQTFAFAATATQAANIQGANFLLLNTTAPFNGVTLSAPLGLPSSYNLTFPLSLPTGTNSFVVLDSTGNLSAPWKLDFNTLNVNGSNQIFAVPLNDIIKDFSLFGSFAGTTFPLTNIDIFPISRNLQVINVIAYWGTIGSGTTEIDVKYAATPTSTFNSIFNTTPRVINTASNERYVDSAGLYAATTGVTAPVLNTTISNSLAAGGVLRFDLVQGSPTGAKAKIVVVMRPV
jgi:hypothetical protein